MDFVKGHGTENDFVVLPDDDARVGLDPGRVAALCDRRRGLGADGVLRVARTGALVAAGVLDAAEVRGMDPELWFMDYRNADGSIAEMCGNGVRVFAHFLLSSGRAGAGRFAVGTRAGVREVRIDGAAGEARARVSVDMGRVRGYGRSEAVLGGAGAPVLAGVAVDVGNPHLACVVDGLDPAGLRTLDLGARPRVDGALFPEGVNVEVLTAPHGGAVHMRVHERGVGETRSCGTGTVAAAYAALASSGESSGRLDVIVPGGRVAVTIGPDGHAVLEGPSVLVAVGTVDERWWARAGAGGDAAGSAQAVAAR